MSEKKFRKKCTEKVTGSKILAMRGRGDFINFYLAPPQITPPKIPRPDAATDHLFDHSLKTTNSTVFVKIKRLNTYVSPPVNAFIQGMQALIGLTNNLLAS